MKMTQNDNGSSHAVLWDMDGVLIDSGELHYATWRQVLAEQGIALSAERFRELFGMHNLSFMQQVAAELDSVTARWVVERKEAIYLDLALQHAALLPGVTDWLARLQRQGVPMAVASGAPQHIIEALMEHLGVAGYFTALVSSDGMPGKPDPAVFLEAARRVGAAPHRCIVVEDAPHGLDAARQAGMRTIAVATTHPASELRAELVVKRLADLPLNAFDRGRLVG